jgi:hypothetical protein
MARLVGPNIDDAGKPPLQRRARRNGCGIEEEIRDIPCSAALEQPTATGSLGNEIAGLFAKVGLQTDIPELRGHKIKPFATLSG